MRIFFALCLLVSPLLAEDPVESKPIVVALIGDSTMTDSAGWGKAFAERFSDSVTVMNFAAGGRSSKSWLAEGRMDAVIAAKPDFALIQFGHNGQPGKGQKRETDPATTYRDFLQTYVKTMREMGTKPILVSSVTRRDFTEEGRIRIEVTEEELAGGRATRPLLPWAEAAREVAAELDVPFVDLYQLSVAYHDEIGPEKSASFNPKEADITHYNEAGAEAISGLVIEELRRIDSPLVTFLRP